MLVDAQLLSQLDVDVILHGSVCGHVELTAVLLISVLLGFPVLCLALGGNLEYVRVDIAAKERRGACLGVEVRLGHGLSAQFGLLVGLEHRGLMVLASQVSDFRGGCFRPVHLEHVLHASLGVDLCSAWLAGCSLNDGLVK